ncbi:hypothetical protein [Flavobacterium muglaense]|uniref:Uncharacterized protein n=1 Tax=Flavobacterium muglaense TaxID=2764716 RepID=A0A923SGU7_9FLAO|nr:hypothetical protein [Flavobacterium muglaense]MBC5839581.1 hypothetical protein [Flavobacterium muglaense]MBC5846117.1 hypothetical protein [Flavobacterium muglaense]
MEWNKMEGLLEKYFEGDTNVDEENALRHYFLSDDVPPHLEQYKAIFGYFAKAKKENLTSNAVDSQLFLSKKRLALWLPVAASVVVMLGVGGYFYFGSTNEKQDLGTYQSPEVALKETQKALAMLSTHVNTGIESVMYIKEYEHSKGLIFKKQ